MILKLVELNLSQHGKMPESLDNTGNVLKTLKMCRLKTKER